MNCSELLINSKSTNYIHLSRKLYPQFVALGQWNELLYTFRICVACSEQQTTTILKQSHKVNHLHDRDCHGDREDDNEGTVSNVTYEVSPPF